MPKFNKSPRKRRKLTAKQRAALDNQGKKGRHDHAHIHCVGCGKHLHGHQFDDQPATATYIACDHGSQFATCTGCVDVSRELLAEHDRTGQPVKAAAAWH